MVEEHVKGHLGDVISQTQIVRKYCKTNDSVSLTINGKGKKVGGTAKD